MAINQPASFNVNTGSVSGNFWVTNQVYISPDYSSARVFMDLYTNQAAYVSGAAPIYQTDYLLTGQAAATAFTKKKLATLSDPALLANVPQFSGGSYVSGL